MLKFQLACVLLFFLRCHLHERTTKKHRNQNEKPVANFPTNIALPTIRHALVFVLNVSLLVVAVLELYSWYSFKSINDGNWHAGARLLKERTAVDMYANDIFTHGRRTLVTPFDASGCNIHFKTKWIFYWTVVTCHADDTQGGLTYTARYLNTKSVTYYFKGLWLGVDQRTLERSKAL